MVAATSTLPPSTAALPSITSASPAVSGANQTLNENDFLSLLTAQLENQDPLNPMTGSDFAAELAQFSTATGVQGLQTSMTGMNGNLTGMQATSLVGQTVVVSGNGLTLGSNGTATGAVNLSAAATNVAVKVQNAAGTTVATLNLGAMPAGLQTFSWNGQMADGTQLPAGSYQFSVSAVGANKATVTATPSQVGQVSAVSLGGQNGPTLQFNGGLAPVAFSAIQEVL